MPLRPPFVDKTRFAVFAELIKARLTFLVLLTTLVGFYAGVIRDGSDGFALLIHTMIGTALVASGAAALNQLLEREHDAHMERTEDRPLPSGRMQPSTVLILGGLSGGGLGLIYLAVAVNPLTSLLGAITLGSYLFIYTPLKRVTTLNTIIGAIPGALPPLMGWTAARGNISAGGWSLFAILFFWQLPHFLAIAWIYREQYERAGFVMLPVVDPAGRTDWAAGGEPHAGFAAGELGAGAVQAGRAGLSVRARWRWGWCFLWFAIQFSRGLNVRARGSCSLRRSFICRCYWA